MGRLKDKQLLEMSKPQGDYDLVLLHRHVEGRVRRQEPGPAAGAVLRQRGAGRPGLRHEGHHPDLPREPRAWSAARRAICAGPGAKLYGLPYGAETSVLAYRTDIFAKHNLKAPENYDDFAEDPARHQGQGRHRRADLARPGRPPVRARVAAAPESAGRRVFDDQWRPRFNDKIGVRGAEVPPGGGGHRAGRHPRLRPGRRQHRVPAGAGGDVPRLDLVRRPGERPEDQQGGRAR